MWWFVFHVVAVKIIVFFSLPSILYSVFMLFLKLDDTLWKSLTLRNISKCEVLLDIKTEVLVVDIHFIFVKQSQNTLPTPHPPPPTRCGWEKSAGWEFYAYILYAKIIPKWKIFFVYYCKHRFVRKRLLFQILL